MIRNLRRSAYTRLMLAAGDLRKAGTRQQVLANDRYRELSAAGVAEPDKDTGAAVLAFKGVLYTVAAEEMHRAAQWLRTPRKA